ncbi:MAG: cation:proton antiporter [Candidatus Eisenbacteria bacterium]|nr:cation:proton antiporter [Candidatus Latescibacterota bacterium]MBD3301627.1 cation:proton antiporter [Candidatus Eisenbacteria bacterium]
MNVRLLTNRRLLALVLVLAALAIGGLPVLAADDGGHAEEGGHGAAVANVVLSLAVILAGAKLGGDLAVRIQQPAVLGELVFGVLLGNLGLLGIDVAEAMKQNEVLSIIAEIGVIILLFEVGLESTVRDMMRVGLPSLLVALLGIVTPFALGFGVGMWLLPNHSIYVSIFLGATLTATSVGITARVLQDLGKSRSKEARVILGAAVIDDILGLVILAVVVGMITAANQGTDLSGGSIALIFGKAILFLAGAIGIGLLVSPRLFYVASKLRVRGVLLSFALGICFLFAAIAGKIGLAPIVGAYAAGLILEDVHFRGFVGREEHELEELIQPISAFLVPVFFVLMGMRVELSAFARSEVLGLAALLTLAAIIGKQACSLGAIGDRLDRLSIGIGMIPRGEVGLIFANIGLTLTLAGERIVDEAIFSAVVIMVIITTMATPPALKWSLARGDRGAAGREGGASAAPEGSERV